MLKKRIIPKFLLSDGKLVKFVQFFDNMRIAGSPVSTAKIYNDYGADELFILNIDPSPGSLERAAGIVERLSEEVFMPLTVGGGITTLDQINLLLRSGADKVSVNTAAFAKPGFVTQAAHAFGSQCVTVSIDYRRTPAGVDRVFVDGGRTQIPYSPLEWAQRMQDAGCGEVLLTSIDRDGTLTGYDLETVARVAEALDTPVVASGGAGSVQHCIDALQTEVSAIAVSSLFFFTDHSPIKLRSRLLSSGLDVRASRTSRN